MMEFTMQPYGVYIRTDKKSRITAINSDAFLPDTDGWEKIDEGFGDKYHHAQGNYLPGPLVDMRGILRYMAAPVAEWPGRSAIAEFVHEHGEEWAVYERTQEEMDADYAARPFPEPTDNELLLEMAADHEYRICLMELGVNANDL